MEKYYTCLISCVNIITNIIVFTSSAEDMIYINVNILDLNDNKPEFLTSENPVEISVSSHLETGELIAKMEVRLLLNLIYVIC